MAYGVKFHFKPTEREKSISFNKCHFKFFLRISLHDLDIVFFNILFLKYCFD